jgi:5-methylcytosine-specific restriction endonuclease McrA
MSTLVYVINQNGQPLMPCRPSKARKLLRDRRARVIGRCPFTIKLLWDCEKQVQEVTLGIDKGSQYQDPTRLDENLRIACLMRDGYRCQQCGKENTRLEAHHLVFKEHGGKDTLANLLCLCEQCHHKVHEGKLPLKASGVSGHLDQIAQRTMQGKSYLYATLGRQVPLSTLFGYQTATLRKLRNLPKAHDADALCIATYQTGEMVPYDQEHFYQITLRPRRTRRQYHTLPRKGQGRVRYQVNEELEGFRKGDIVRVKGKYLKQINSIYSNGYLAFKRVKGEPNQARPQDCQLLERGQTILWEKGHKT